MKLMIKDETDSIIEPTVETDVKEVLEAAEGIRESVLLDLYSHKLVGSISPHWKSELSEGARSDEQ